MLRSYVPDDRPNFGFGRRIIDRVADRRTPHPPVAHWVRFDPDVVEGATDDSEFESNRPRRRALIDSLIDVTLHGVMRDAIRGLLPESPLSVALNDRCVPAARAVPEVDSRLDPLLRG